MRLRILLVRMRRKATINKTPITAYNQKDGAVEVAPGPVVGAVAGFSSCCLMYARMERISSSENCVKAGISVLPYSLYILSASLSPAERNKALFRIHLISQSSDSLL